MTRFLKRCQEGRANRKVAKDHTKKTRQCLIRKAAKHHGFLFARCLMFLIKTRWIPTPSALPGLAKRMWCECTLKPCELVEREKQSPDVGDKSHLWDAVIAGVLTTFAAFTRARGWPLWFLMSIAVLRLVPMLRDDVGLLWFDDLVVEDEDPRVHSFRRLSVHVMIQVFEIVLLFSVLYKFARPACDFRMLLFSSFQATMTLNYDETTHLPGWLWGLQILLSVLVVVVILAVVAGERHTRQEIAPDPGQEWERRRLPIIEE